TPLIHRNSGLDALGWAVTAFLVAGAIVHLMMFRDGAGQAGLDTSGKRNGAVAAGEQSPSAPRGRIGRCLVYFGSFWWLVSIAPLAMTYVVPRHLYLAAVGPSLITGLALQSLALWGRRLTTSLAILAAASL